MDRQVNGKNGQSLGKRAAGWNIDELPNSSKVQPTIPANDLNDLLTPNGSDGKEEIRAVLNAGFQKGAKVPRCVGPTHVLAEFSVFCPKALAGIGKLPDTVADRSIPIVLARKARGNQLAKFRFRTVSPRAKLLHEALAGWAPTRRYYRRWLRRSR